MKPWRPWAQQGPAEVLSAAEVLMLRNQLVMLEALHTCVRTSHSQGVPFAEISRNLRILEERMTETQRVVGGL